METKNNKTTAWVVGGVVLVLLAAGVAGFALMNQPAEQKTETETTTETTPTTDATTENDSKPANEAPASATTITFTDNGFSPTGYTVKKGEVVTVKNSSSMSLQFSSDDHPTHTEESELNLSVLAPGSEATFTPTRVGEWGFHDHLNDQFVGSLKVTD